MLTVVPVGKIQNLANIRMDVASHLEESRHRAKTKVFFFINHYHELICWRFVLDHLQALEKFTSACFTITLTSMGCKS